ncbi:hypothetical protein SAMN04488563_6913 [Jiangella alkaliphila]|uniref:Uncharacterized protein n=1 Tax=Jiangella alkaliphila TaxID=419479 RepID=A0A1H2M0B9_9ACTN|nr:hypothetical protein SAMN04488563_6913 [Jiangella alkaliphila]
MAVQDAQRLGPPGVLLEPREAVVNVQPPRSVAGALHGGAPDAVAGGLVLPGEQRRRLSLGHPGPPRRRDHLAAVAERVVEGMGEPERTGRLRPGREQLSGVGIGDGPPHVLVIAGRGPAGQRVDAVAGQHDRVVVGASVALVDRNAVGPDRVLWVVQAEYAVPAVRAVWGGPDADARRPQPGWQLGSERAATPASPAAFGAIWSAGPGIARGVPRVRERSRGAGSGRAGRAPRSVSVPSRA